MTKLRFAVFGAGFWSHYQLAAWRELPQAECVAIYNRTRSKAENLAKTFDVPAAYDNAEELLGREKLDFIDVITDMGTHSQFVYLAADHKLPVICQKPLAPSFAEAERMVAACEKAGVPLLVHENWRWQRPIREVKRILEEGIIGQPFRARIDMNSGFPVFQNQPFLKELEQFIITDMGSHTLDTARFLFGEASSLCCHTRRVHKNIKGEDAATILLDMKDGASVTVNMAYAENFLEHDCFPQTYIFVEADQGSLELGPDYWIRVTTRDGTHARRYPPPRYAWANFAYDVVHSSIVACHSNLLQSLLGQNPAETTGSDNLKTLRLVFGAYESARERQVFHF